MGIGAFDVAGVMQGGWQNLMSAPMGGGTLDAPGEFLAAGGVGLGVGGGGGGEEEELGLAMAGNEVGLCSFHDAGGAGREGEGEGEGEADFCGVRTVCC